MNIIALGEICLMTAMRCGKDGQSFIYIFIYSLIKFLNNSGDKGMVVGMGWKEAKKINICIKYNSNHQVIDENVFVYLCH